MNTTKILRFLSKIGIGSPLNQLMYTSDEIEKMKSDGRLFHVSKTPRILLRLDGRVDCRMYGKGRPTLKRRGTFQVQLASGTRVSKYFKDADNARRWDLWNYKGNTNWSIVPTV